MNEPSTLDIVNKLPITLYFASIPDRQQVLKYINYLYINVPASKDVLPDKLFREVIAKHLRIVNMKIIEPEILIVIALNNPCIFYKIVCKQPCITRGGDE